MDGQFQYGFSGGMKVGATPEMECHFQAPARCGRRRSDQYGQLRMVTEWLKFTGAIDLSVAWTEVTAVQRNDGDLIVILADHGQSLRFACQSIADAARAEAVAKHLCDAAAIGSATQPPRDFTAV